MSESVIEAEMLVLNATAKLHFTCPECHVLKPAQSDTKGVALTSF